MKEVFNLIKTGTFVYAKLWILAIIAFFLFFGIMSWLGSHIS